MSEFTPSVRLIAAMAINPEVFARLKEADIEYFRDSHSTAAHSWLASGIPILNEIEAQFGVSVRDEADDWIDSLNDKHIEEGKRRDEAEKTRT